MNETALILARMQFAANITFHILFPTITIALGWILFFFRMRFKATRDEAWEEAYYFWTKIFALTFALGVVSGWAHGAEGVVAFARENGSGRFDGPPGAEEGRIP